MVCKNRLVKVDLLANLDDFSQFVHEMSIGGFIGTIN